MPVQFHDKLHPESLKNINYGFHTIEAGTSDNEHYQMATKDSSVQGTRNVNLFSAGLDPENPSKDLPENVAENIRRCFEELDNNDAKYRIFLTTQYSKGPFSTDNNPVIHNITPNSIDDALDISAQYMSESTMHEDLKAKLKALNIIVLPADAVIVSGFEQDVVSVCGASGDAHPVIMFDDEQAVGAYISGAHANIRSGVIHQTIDKMTTVGARESDINVVTGPGLGPDSYEFGPNAADLFGQDLNKPTFIRSVTDNQGNQKCLLNMPNIINQKATHAGIVQENILDMALDTYGCKLYDENGQAITDDQRKQLAKSSAVDTLFFGARRGTEILEGNNNPAAHSKIGRHGTGLCIGPKLRKN